MFPGVGEVFRLSQNGYSKSPFSSSRAPSVFDVLLNSPRDRALVGLAEHKLVLLVSDSSTRCDVQQELLCRHAYMLKGISARMHSRGTGGAELHDYEAQSILGAYVSYDKFDSSKGVRLSTYTYATVVRHIQDAQRRAHFEQGVRLPPTLLRHRPYLLGDYDPYPSFKRAYEERNGLTPEVIAALRRHELFGLIYGMDSTDSMQVPDTEDGSLYVIDTIPDPSAPTEDDIVDMAMLSSAVAALGSEKDRSVAQMLLLERRPLDDVAVETGLSPQQLRRSLSRSGKKLGRLVNGGSEKKSRGTAPGD